MLDWKAQATLTACLLQQTHAGGRAAAVALHAAVLEQRINQLVLHAAPLSYKQPLAQPATKDPHSSLLPGVLRCCDLPGLQRVLSSKWVLEQRLRRLGLYCAASLKLVSCTSRELPPTNTLKSPGSDAHFRSLL